MIHDLDTADLPDQSVRSVGRPPRTSSSHTAAHAAPTNVGGATERVDPEFVVNPFRIAIDTREQFPWSFRGMHTDPVVRQRGGQKEKVHHPLIVPTIVKTLRTADYSIDGFEEQVVVERKSLPDLYGTLTGGRERFDNELQRMAAIITAGGVAAVIVEASWQSILYSPPPNSRVSPKSIYRSILAWQQREPYRGIHWLMCDTREIAERFCFRWLERFWLDKQE